MLLSLCVSLLSLQVVFELDESLQRARKEVQESRGGWGRACELHHTSKCLTINAMDSDTLGDIMAAVHTQQRETQTPAY